MSERGRFVIEHQSGEWSMSELCEAFGVSRKTGYKWLERFRQDGFAGLSDRSHAPLRHGRTTPEAVSAAIEDLRRAHPGWGPRKLIARLATLSPEIDWPSASTAGEILKRAGLVSGRRPVRRVPPRSGGLTEAERPNHVWRADHKGWFRTRDGSRVEPLTVTDGFSRYLLVLSHGASTREAEAKPLFERAFRDHGLPEIVRSDNGAPFACAGVSGLSALAVWWIKLGIRHERIDPGQPTQNGSHERFHATLAEAIRPPAADRAEQADRFDSFRRIYNEERPHQALGQKPPASLWTPSPRAFPEQLPEPDYPPEAAVRRVRQNGEIKWRGRMVFLSTTLVGEPVALVETEAGDFEVRFHAAVLGTIDPVHSKLRPRPRPKPHPATENTPNL